MNEQNRVLNVIRYIIAIPCGFLGAILVIFLWNMVSSLPFARDRMYQIGWYRKIWGTTVYCVALYSIVHYIVPHYKRLIAGISLVLYSILSIISISLLTGSGIRTTGTFSFRVILSVIILVISIYSISKCNGQYKNGE